MVSENAELNYENVDEQAVSKTAPEEQVKLFLVSFKIEPKLHGAAFLSS